MHTSPVVASHQALLRQNYHLICPDYHTAHLVALSHYISSIKPQPLSRRSLSLVTRPIRTFVRTPDMRLLELLLLALRMGVILVAALDSLYLGNITTCGTNKYGPDWFIWFTDSPPCASGVDAGPTRNFGNGLCDEGDSFTIEGHNDITFTGCTPKAPPYYVPGPPTSALDHGVPALKCEPVSLPDQYCPSPCGSPFPDVLLKTAYLCS